MTALFWAWLPAFVATYWIETPFFVLIGRDRVPTRTILWQSLLVQTTTHPLLWWYFGWLIQKTGSFTAALLLGETIVVAVEALLLVWLWRPHTRTALWAVLVANVSSTAIGVLASFR